MTGVITFVALVLCLGGPLCGHHLVLPDMARAARARLTTTPIPHPRRNR
ncbi:hypothetical protein [Streptomyces sp. NPDC093223]